MTRNRDELGGSCPEIIGQGLVSDITGVTLEPLVPFWWFTSGCQTSLTNPNF
jgi:hypothetical protein